MNKILKRKYLNLFHKPLDLYFENIFIDFPHVYSQEYPFIFIGVITQFIPKPGGFKLYNFKCIQTRQIIY